MKKRILIAILLLILALALIACDNNSAPTECEHSWGSWIGTNDGHYHICDKCDAQSKVFNHNCGDVYDIVDGDYIAECRVCKCKVHTPVYPSVEVTSESQNATYLAEINQAFQALDEIADNGNISASMDMWVNKQCLANVDFSCKSSSELYLEIRGKNAVIYHEENGRIFSYTKKRMQKYDYERKYVCDKDDFLIPSELFASIDVDTEIDLDVSKCNITKDGNKYKIEAYATDIIGEDVTAMLTEIYKQYGLDDAILSEITVQIELEFTQTSYNMTTNMSMFMAVEGQIVEIPYWTGISIDFSDIEEIDFFGGEYTISPPSCIEEVYTISDVTEIFKNDGRYYGVQLEKGQYYAYFYDDWNYMDDAYTFGGCPFKVYDETGEEIKIFDAESGKFYSYNFVIPNDGIYYLLLEGQFHDNAELIRCDYETIYDLNDPKRFDMNVSGVIEGLYDLEYYVFTSENRESMTIKNTSDVTLYIFVNRTEYILKAGEEKMVSFEKGENKIIITAKNITEKVNYSLECVLLSS